MVTIIKKLVMNSDKNGVKISFEKFANILTKFDKSLRKKTSSFTAFSFKF